METDDQADDLTSSINELYIEANLENSMNLNLTEFLSFDDSLNCNSTLVLNLNLAIEEILKEHDLKETLLSKTENEDDSESANSLADELKSCINCQEALTIMQELLTFSSINEPSIFPRLKSINHDLMISYSYKVTEKKQTTIDRYLIR